MYLYIQIYLINVSIYIYINYFIQYIPFLQIPVLFLQEYSNSCGIQSHSSGFQWIPAGMWGASRSTVQRQWNIGARVWNDCLTFWAGDLGWKLWYSLTIMRHQTTMPMNLAILTKCFFCILPDYGQGWREWSRLTSFSGVKSFLLYWR